MTYKTKKREEFPYKGNFVEFRLGEKIGRGGNGTVYKLQCKSTVYEELVVKVLNPYNYGDNPYPEKKYNRFKIEVEQGKRLGELNSCFLQIIDYYLPAVPMRNNRPWFVMPCAESFKERILKLKLTVEEKIDLILEIGNAIKILHDNGYAHRDIKLDNILIHQNKIVMCDFGLIRHDSLDRLTDLNEPIGPWNTIAPEMKRVASKFTVPKEADIYSFGKLIWIILTEDEHCFDGKYSRYDIMSLNSNEKTRVGGLRVIHELLESTTENLPSQRPNIDEVLEKIRHWKTVLNDESLIRVEDNLELYEQIPNQHVPSEYIYRDPNQIYEILSKLINDHNLYKESIGMVGPILEIKRANIENCFRLNTKNKIYIFRPSLLRCVNNEWFLNTIEVDKKALEREGILLNKSKNDILESLFEQVIPKKYKDKTYEVIDKENDILLQYKF